MSMVGRDGNNPSRSVQWIGLKVGVYHALSLRASNEAGKLAQWLYTIMY